MQTISTEKSFGGIQGVYADASDPCGCNMTFAVFVPPQASERKLSILCLSGLTCTHANVMEKGEYRRLAAELGVVVVCPGTRVATTFQTNRTTGNSGRELASMWTP